MLLFLEDSLHPLSDVRALERLIVCRFPPMIELLFVHWLAKQIALHKVAAVRRKPLVHHVMLNALSRNGLILCMTQFYNWFDDMPIIGVHQG